VCTQIHLVDASLYLEEAMDPQCDNDEALRLLGSAKFVPAPDQQHASITAD
jgi:hypothetical protein